MNNTLGDALYGLEKLIQRATNRMYSYRVEKVKSKFILIDAMTFIHSMSLLGHPKKDEGSFIEPPFSEPVLVNSKDIGVQ